MNKQLFVLVAAVALGLCACNDASSPTGVGRDLLSSSGKTPPVNQSKYGQVLEDDNDEDPCKLKKYETADDPVPPSDTNPGGYDHITGGSNNTKWVPPCYIHITEQNSTQAARDAGHVSKYRHVKKMVHISKDQARVDGTNDATKYKPNARDHRGEGENKSLYYPW